VHEYIKEHEDLLEDSELDSITTSRLASNSSSLLLELSGEIKEASRTKGFPPNKLRRKMKAFDKLKVFCERPGPRKTRRRPHTVCRARLRLLTNPPATLVSGY
jgi:hypothetical protein